VAISGASTGQRHGDLTAELIETDVWTDDVVHRAGIPIYDVPFVTVGGGIGSFVVTDLLRVSGAPTASVRILSGLDYPWQTYQYLTQASQIPVGERLRSDASSMPDNVWGFPSYALREAREERSLAPLWNVLTEPILTNYYTPKAGMVFRGLQKEAERIDYWSMLVKGQVRMVRRRLDGGYLTILTPPAGTSPTVRVAFRSRWVHLAVGYPGVKFLDDLQEYRTKYNDPIRVVNAYEPHEHVYEELLRRPGIVVIRGGGIVASRVLQRLIDDRDNKGAKSTILHLFRTYITGAQGDSIFMRRPGGDGWAYQGFNYPKSAWGGQLWRKFRTLEGEDRAKLYKAIGGTNTPKRKLWMHQLARGRQEGWYQVHVGTVKEVMPGPDGTVVTRIQSPPEQSQSTVLEVPAHFIIDCTGLEADIAEHRVLNDLLDHSGAGRNPVGRLDVERDFEVRGTRSGAGKMYATGSMTLGGYFPGVDTFLGLQLASSYVVDDLADQGFVPGLGPTRSFRQWVKWMRHERI
jgi:hypothetical protein